MQVQTQICTVMFSTAAIAQYIVSLKQLGGIKNQLTMAGFTPFTAVLLNHGPPRIRHLAAAEATTPKVEVELLAGKNAILNHNPIDQQVVEAIRGIQDGNLVVSASSS